MTGVEAQGHATAAGPELDPALTEALRMLAGTDILLVALDFDGTLSNVVDAPGSARAIPEARSAVLRLAALPRTRVALVSGRSLASLEHVAEVPDSILLVGSHGVEVRLDGPASLELDGAERRKVDALRRLLDEAAAPYEKAWVEEKPAGFALHTRLATPHDRERADQAALDALAGDDELAALSVRRGKNVLEFSVRHETKGEAVRRLKDYTGATAALFAGDDVTDEDGFASLAPGDLGLKVGSGDTLAGFRVGEPREVASALHLLAGLRG